MRNRAKIRATITNARATVSLQRRGTSLSALVWRHRVDSPSAAASLGKVLALTPESRALSAELRRRGFAFVGPRTVYSALQVLGVVNDHLRGCRWRDGVERERAAFVASA